MALTALIRSIVGYLLAWLLATPPAAALLGWLTDTAGWRFDVDRATGWLTVLLYGVVVYVGNKLGSRWGFINQILSLGRAKSAPVYIPNGQESVTATVTPPGAQTMVTVEDSGGTHLAAAS